MAQLRTRVDPLSGEVVESPEIRDFAATLMDLDKGRLHTDLSEGLWDVIQRVEELHKKGTLTLTIAVEPTGKSDGSPLSISGEVKLRLPEPPSMPTIMWADRQGNLVRNDPNQPEIEGLRVIDDTRNTRRI